MRKSLLVSILFVLLALFLLLFGLNMDTDVESKGSAPLVLWVENDTGAFVMQLKQGMQKAADEAGIQLIQEIVTAQNVTSLSQEWKGKAKRGVLLFLEDEHLLQTALSGLEGTQTLCVASSEAPYADVAPDDAHIGEVVAAGLEGYAFAYVVGDGGAREESVRASLDKAGITMLHEPIVQGQEAIVLALTAQDTLRLAEEKKSGAWAYPLIGVDPGEARAALLEEGVTSALIFASPYAMGYEAAEMLLGVEKKTGRVAYTLVPRTQMYNARYVKLVFPLLQ